MEETFEERNRRMIDALNCDDAVRELTREWFDRVADYEYSYHFTWLGMPIIQFPQDIVALQEIIWRVKPDVIVETGIARGGSLILSASLLELLGGENRHVIGVDIDIRAHNRAAIDAHPLAHRIHMIEGSSLDEAVVAEVRRLTEDATAVLVILDSNHTHEHVLRELELYSPLVALGSYIIVFDTVIELMREDAFSGRPWGAGNNAGTAVAAFLATTDRFEADDMITNKLVISVAPGGYLRCVR